MREGLFALMYHSYTQSLYAAAIVLIMDIRNFFMMHLYLLRRLSVSLCSSLPVC